MGVRTSWIRATTLALAMAATQAAPANASPANPGTPDAARAQDGWTVESALATAQAAVATRHPEARPGADAGQGGSPGGTPEAEPSTLALAFAGLGLVAWAVRRGRHDA